jgi:hypothetical protein
VISYHAVRTPLFRLLFLGALACQFLLTSGPHALVVSAAPVTLTLDVNNTADVRDVNPGNGVCETAFQNGICTLRAAIMEANASLGSDVVNLQPGITYYLSRPGVDDTAENGDLDITDPVTINGAGATINASQVDRVFDIPNMFTFVHLNNLTIRNGLSSGDGGGIRNKGFLTLSNMHVIQNESSGEGGGLANSGASAIAVLQNSSVMTNTGGLGGGGLYNGEGTLTLVASYINGNRETFAYGGGIHNINGTVMVQNSTISRNTSKGNGGGIANSGLGIGDAVTTLINSTVANNIADSNGGGIYDDGGTNNTPANVFLYNATIYGNVAVNYSGGGISVNPGFPDYVTIWNTLISSNRLQSNVGPLQECDGTLNSQDYNLIRTTTGCTLNGITTHNKTNVSASVGTLQFNGGATPTVALLAGSPAIDGGNPAGCIDDSAALLTTDQRGFLRPVGMRCDIGAFEYGAFLVTNKLFLPIAVR